MNILCKIMIWMILFCSFCFADKQDEARALLQKAFDILNNRTYTLDYYGSISIQDIKDDGKDKDVIKHLVKQDGSVLHAMVFKEWISPSKNLVRREVINKDGGCYELTMYPQNPDTSYCIFTPEPWQKRKINPVNKYILKQEKVKIHGFPCHVIVSTGKNGYKDEFFVDCRTGCLSCSKNYGKNGNMYGQAYYLNYSFDSNLTEADFAIPEGMKIHAAKNSKEYTRVSAELMKKAIYATRKGNPNRHNRGKRIARSFSSYAASGDMTNDFLRVAPYVACGVAVIAAGAAFFLKMKKSK